MRPKTLLALAVAGVVAVAGGWYFGAATTPTQLVSVDTGKLMFPDLAPKLQAATKIEVVHQGKTLAIEKQAERWGVAERGGYKVQDSKLRGMLTALTELRLVEPRTTDPAQFGRLGVEDPNAADGTSNLLRVLDGGGKPMVALIVGHRRVRTQGNVPEQVYVRRPNEQQAWLAEGSLQVDSDPQLWLDRDVLNIEHGRIASVSVSRDEQTLAFAREGDKLVLKTPADHPPLDDYKLEDVARGLELLTFQDVRPDKDAPGQPVGQAVFTTTDGVAITATVLRADKDIWARFTASGDEKAKAEADRLTAKLAGWSYQLGSWKEKALVPTLDDLKAADKAGAEKPGASVPGTPAPASDEPAKQ
jgi:hypothetical protein